MTALEKPRHTGAKIFYSGVVILLGAACWLHWMFGLTLLGLFLLIGGLAEHEREQRSRKGRIE